MIIMIVLTGGGGVFGVNMKDSGGAGFLIIASSVVSIQTLVCVMCAGIAGFFVILAVVPPVSIILFVFIKKQ